MRIRYVLLALLAGCGGPSTCGCGPPLTTTGTALTLRASVDGGTTTSVTSPYALNLPKIGDVGVVTAYERNQQVSFSLVPSPSCANVVTISPGTQAMQQAVTAVKNGGQCTATALTGNSMAALTIYALPPP